MKVCSALFSSTRTAAVMRGGSNRPNSTWSAPHAGARSTRPRILTASGFVRPAKSGEPSQQRASSWFTSNAGELKCAASSRRSRSSPSSFTHEPACIASTTAGGRCASFRRLGASPLDRLMRVNIFTRVDMRGALMLRLFKRRTEFAVEFCERCARVCDAGCRRAALWEQALLQAWRYGARI